MTISIAINGFGRIGRNIVRQLFSAKTSHDISVVAINDLTDAATLAHLLKYDSVHGTFCADITHDKGTISIDGKEIKILSERNPSSLQWKELKVDVVLECTGVFRTKEQASQHIQAGAKKVVISAPSPDPDCTIAYGVNSEVYDADKHTVLSAASCTTNCLAPVAKVLQENFGIVRGTMTTIHSYTNDQKILDLPHKDLRRARAAAMNMIPTTTGAAKAVGLVLPELNGKIDGFAIRVPTCNVSLVDFVVELEREASAKDLNKALSDASEGSLKGVLGFSEEPLVSVDYIGNTASSTVDALSTMSIDNKLAKVVAWYDNEMGFSNRMINLTELIGA